MKVVMIACAALFGAISGIGIYAMLTPGRSPAEVVADLKPGRVWPDANCDIVGASSGSGDEQWVDKEVSPGKCQWVLDTEGMAEIAKSEQQKHDLYWALRTRVLSDAEMAEVERLGVYITVSNGQSYREEEKQHELNDALLLQYKLRDSAKRQ